MAKISQTAKGHSISMAAAIQTGKRSLLITGATGKQGGATIDALIAAGALTTHKLLAVTRSPGSGAAQKLVTCGVKVVQGDLRDVPAIFAAAERVLVETGSEPKVHGVYSVQTFAGGGASTETEEAQGKALIDGALAHGVDFFVYSSADRGGNSRSGDNPTKVPHFVSKHNIEQHLTERTAVTTGDNSTPSNASMRWSILRPVAFMENMEPGIGARLMAAAWRTQLGGKPFQLVSTRDVGWFAAQALLRPDAFAGRALSLAGDALSFTQADEAFRAGVDRPMPLVPGLCVRAVLWLSPEFGEVIRWVCEDGFGADIPACRAEHPGMTTWEGWLGRESSGWVKESVAKTQ